MEYSKKWSKSLTAKGSSMVRLLTQRNGTTSAMYYAISEEGVVSEHPAVLVSVGNGNALESTS